jgi:NAD(P)-dependent dehydrogenase (short-subunit alcohol dehydrogenase family)
MKNLNDKVAIVTGSSRGIGKAIAIELASNGVNVVINYQETVQLANKTKKEVEIVGGN